LFPKVCCNRWFLPSVLSTPPSPEYLLCHTPTSGGIAGCSVVSAVCFLLHINMRYDACSTTYPRWPVGCSITPPLVAYSLTMAPVAAPHLHMSSKTEKPTLTGQRIRSRKRDEKSKFDPATFRDILVAGLIEVCALPPRLFLGTPIQPTLCYLSRSTCCRSLLQFLGCCPYHPPRGPLTSPLLQFIHCWLYIPPSLFRPSVVELQPHRFSNPRLLAPQPSVVPTLSAYLGLAPSF